MLTRLRAELGPAVVVISHDLASMAGVVDRDVVLYEGQVVEQGPAERVLSAPEHEYTQLLIAAAPASVRERLRATSTGAMSVFT